MWYWPSDFDPNEDQKTIASKVYVRFERCANHGKRDCQITELRIYVTGLDVEVRPVACPINLTGEITKPACKIPNLDGWAPIPNVDPIQLAASTVQIVLADALGKEHRNITTRRSDMPFIRAPFFPGGSVAP